jgi:hypothetical protein
MGRSQSVAHEAKQHTGLVGRVGLEPTCEIIAGSARVLDVSRVAGVLDSSGDSRNSQLSIAKSKIADPVPRQDLLADNALRSVWKQP